MGVRQREGSEVSDRGMYHGERVAASERASGLGSLYIASTIAPTSHISHNNDNQSKHSHSHSHSSHGHSNHSHRHNHNKPKPFA